MAQSRECGVEKGVHILWVVQVEGNKRYMVGIVVGVVNLQEF
jgi:hypothetical protein